MPAISLPAAPKILVIRRDNIGDLVCTTPLFRALKQRFPAAHVAALVNSYNAPALAGNPDVDAIHVYTKSKHLGAGGSRLGTWWRTARLILGLRGTGFDLAIVASPGAQASAIRFARLVRPGRVLAYGSDPQALADGLSPEVAGQGHEVEAVMRLLLPLGIEGPAGPVRVHADAGRAGALRARLQLPAATAGPRVGLHISARKPSQRWPVERFAELARRLHADHGAHFLLFWSPGAEDHPQHPGDDGKAARLLELCAGLPVAACPTGELAELIAGLSLCHSVVCADGGAMHLAAGLGKPIVCLFGNSGAWRWRPWGVPHQLLQPESLDVADVSVEQVAAAFARLAVRVQPERPAASVASGR